MPRRLLCTVCDDRFAEGAQVMLYSMRRRLTGFADADVKVFYDEQMGGLSAANRAAIARVAPQTRFEPVDAEVYQRARVAVEHHRPALLTLEAFRQYDYDQVLFFDADMLCVGDFADAIDLADKFDFVACEAGKVCPEGRWAEVEGPREGRWGARRFAGLFGRRRHKVNTGLFVVGPRLRTPRVYEALHRVLRNRRTPQHKAMLLDQWAVNEVLGQMRTRHYFLPNGYNLRALARFGGDVAESTRVLHFSGYHQRPKPWAEDAPLDHPAYDAWRACAADLAEEQADCAPHRGYEVSLARYRRDDVAASATISLRRATVLSQRLRRSA